MDHIATIYKAPSAKTGTLRITVKPATRLLAKQPGIMELKDHWYWLI